MAKGIERHGQGNKSILLSVHHLILSKKCQRKVESRATIPDPTQEANIVGDWGGPRGHVVARPNHPQNS